MIELIDALDHISQDAGTRAIILCAAGKVFCSGHDLSEMTGRDINEYRRIFDVCSQLMLKIQAIPQPVIAEVQGVATAAGCQLVAACDLAIAAEDAWFATPGVKIGLFCTTRWLRSPAPSAASARSICCSPATPWTHATAADWGLINQAVPAADLAAATRTLAAKVAEASPLVVSIGNRPSTRRSISTSPRPTPTPRKSCR